MPYVPRRYASTSVPDVVDIPKRPVNEANRGTVPYRPDRAELPERPTPNDKGRLRVQSSLSIRGYAVDPDRVYRMLTGKEPQVDDHTRQLVQSERAAGRD